MSLGNNANSSCSAWPKLLQTPSASVLQSIAPKEPDVLRHAGRLHAISSFNARDFIREVVAICSPGVIFSTSRPAGRIPVPNLPLRHWIPSLSTCPRLINTTGGSLLTKGYRKSDEFLCSGNWCSAIKFPASCLGCAPLFRRCCSGLVPAHLNFLHSAVILSSPVTCIRRNAWESPTSLVHYPACFGSPAGFAHKIAVGYVSRGLQPVFGPAKLLHLSGPKRGLKPATTYLPGTYSQTPQYVQSRAGQAHNGASLDRSSLEELRKVGGFKGGEPAKFR